MKLKDAYSLVGKLWPTQTAYLKSRDIALPSKVHIVNSMVFSVVMYGCETWTIKKAEHRIIDAFELWCWRRLLWVPWTARRSNQSILKEISPEYSLEGLMLKLKLQNFGHLMWRTDSFEKTLMLGKIEGIRRRGRDRMRCLDGITDLMDRKAWRAAVHGVARSWTQQSDWTELNWFIEEEDRWFRSLMTFILTQFEVLFSRVYSIDLRRITFLYSDYNE